MKVLVYVNKEKDVKGNWLSNLKDVLRKYDVEFFEIEKADLKNQYNADAIIVLGGDGTILGLTEFSIQNDIPLIGINAGKCGFLTEFEKFETENAISLLKKGELKKEYRSLITATFNNKKFVALNDVVVQRMFEDNVRNTVININVSIDGDVVDKVRGDGIVVCTPTGSTAYSLSAGGSILAPGINAFSITPIAAHSLSRRPIVYTADSKCEITLSGEDKAGLFIDGVFVSSMGSGDKIIIEKHPKQMVFLRNKQSSFFRRLTLKIREEKSND